MMSFTLMNNRYVVDKFKNYDIEMLAADLIITDFKTEEY